MKRIRFARVLLFFALTGGLFSCWSLAQAQTGGPTIAPGGSATVPTGAPYTSCGPGYTWIISGPVGANSGVLV